ncbi:hypothetical protein HJG53_14910 [Sphingomonas sp. ID1715]|uniref:hypothetical protein n=1 Tax=Sphingomonas sp. ID1715 TaxID=1656898 RepID=UPI001487B3DC|nr:hypothetical protein [Sphingomonas sp. ID1715]NNM78181.1 hypothetical protein [Sphingomonas sp. ID1715]
MKHALILAALVSLAACAGRASDQAEAQADKLDNAAEQSTPEAAEVLEQQADAIRDNGAAGAPGQPGSSVQQAMDKAGEAQATNAAGAAPMPAATPPSKQAVPHGAEKGTPPPKTEAH